MSLLVSFVAKVPLLGRVHFSWAFPLVYAGQNPAIINFHSELDALSLQARAAGPKIFTRITHFHGSNSYYCFILS